MRKELLPFVMGVCVFGLCAGGDTESVRSKQEAKTTMSLNPVGRLKVQHDGGWHRVCCDGNDARVYASKPSGKSCKWGEGGRRIKSDEPASSGVAGESTYLWCPETNVGNCKCRSEPDGEDPPGVNPQLFHGIELNGNGWVSNSLDPATGPGPVYPDRNMPTCVYVTSDDRLATKTNDGSCPDFKLVGFY